VVQLYVRDEYASITPAVKRLRGFEKIELAPNESKTVEFSLHACELAFVNEKNEWILEAGDFKVMIGGEEVRFELKDSNLS